MRCPSCALNNFADVVSCRRCGASLSGPVPGGPSPYRAPSAGASIAPAQRYASGTSAVVDGEIVELPFTGGTLPPVCCKCGTTHGLRARTAKLSYASPGLYVIAFCLAPFGLLFTLLALSLGSKKATIDFPVCPSCDARWRSANIVWTASLLSPIALGILVGMSVSSAGGSNLLAGLGVFLISLVVLPVVARFVFVKPATVVAQSIDDSRVRLAGFSAEARATIERLSGPRGAVWSPGSSVNMGLVALVGVLGVGFFAVLAISGVRRYVANARAARDGSAVSAGQAAGDDVPERPSAEHMAEIDAAHGACLAAADARADREQASAGGDFVKLEKVADRRRIARFACSELKKDCTRGYYSLACQAALSSQKRGSQ